MKRAKKRINRNLKALGLTLVAALALGSVVASGAQAEGKFKAGKYPASLAGTSTGAHVFSFAGGVRKISCGESTFRSSEELTAESESAGIWWNYYLCSVNGGLPFRMSPYGCSLTWSVSKVLSPTTATGAQTYNCPGAGEFQFSIYANAEKEEENIPLCKYGIPSQGPLATIGYENLGSGSTANVNMAINVSSIKVNVLKGGKLICGALTGETTTAQYTGNLNLIAKSAGVQTGLSIG